MSDPLDTRLAELERIRATPPSDEPASTRRINACSRILAGHSDDVLRVLHKLDADELSNVAAAVQQIQRQRAVDEGDHDQIIDQAFEEGFGRDGLGHLPWIQGSLVVCPGGIITKSRSSHRCRFISVNDSWVWDCAELLREDKRSTAGALDGFRAIALVPAIDGMELDVVSGRARSGQHQVDKVISFKVKKGKLIEVAQRNVTPSGMK